MVSVLREENPMVGRISEKKVLSWVYKRGSNDGESDESAEEKVTGRRRGESETDW